MGQTLHVVLQTPTESQQRVTAVVHVPDETNSSCGAADSHRVSAARYSCGSRT